MAIVQVSRITNRKGLQIDLPQLAGAELGWSIDSRRLFIGNGTLQEGAPVIGNTEILTEFSDILEFQTTYTYKGEAAGYVAQTGPTPNNPVTQSLQSWLDQFATVKDFGAVGDGVTDDTEAINRALFQLYCREINPQIRRSLFFPAGVYRVTETILIPPYATLYGEGAEGSVIQLDSATDDSALNAFVARTADSLQQYGVNIGTNGAIAPQYISITNLGFRNLDQTTDVFLVQDASNCRFQNVGFYGTLTTTDLVTDADNVSGVRFASATGLTTQQIVFDQCVFSGTTYGVTTADSVTDIEQEITGIMITNSEFDTLYQGVVVGTGTVTGATTTGLRVMGCLFDMIYAEGIVFGQVRLNASGHNIFNNVGNHFGGYSTPYTANLDIQNDDNISVSDLFARPDFVSDIVNPPFAYPRVTLNGKRSIATVNGAELNLGTLTITSGVDFTLVGGTTNGTVFTLDTDQIKCFTVTYTIVRGTAFRTGLLTVAGDSGTAITYVDDYTENLPTGISFSITLAATVVTVRYTSTAGINGTLSYNITHLA